jgi:hypothetical protein
MKIYLSQKQTPDSAYKNCSNLASLENLCLDGEASSLVIDSFLSSFSYHEISELIKMILKKCRIGCEVTIMEVDCNLLFRQYTRDDIELDYFNALFFESAKKCILNTEAILRLVPENFIVMEKSISNSNFSIIKLRRAK